MNTSPKWKQALIMQAFLLQNKIFLWQFLWDLFKLLKCAVDNRVARLVMYNRNP